MGLNCRVVSRLDLPPLQGTSLWWRFPGLKPWAESSSPFGARQFVPGYYRAVPPGQKPFSHWGFNPGNRPPRVTRPDRQGPAPHRQACGTQTDRLLRFDLVDLLNRLFNLHEGFSQRRTQPD
jgi:hypothetical protein